MRICAICGKEYVRRGNNTVCDNPECQEIKKVLHAHAVVPCVDCGLVWNKEVLGGTRCPRCAGDKEWSKAKERKCLKCDKSYLSLENSDRLCPYCRVRNRVIYSGALDSVPNPVVPERKSA